MLIDISQILISFGYLALFGVLFAETGLLVGFFLPGDTFIFTAGLLASKGILSLPEIILVGFLAAATGDSFGYYLGTKFGKRVFTREDSHFMGYYLNKDNLIKTENFFKRYGAITIFFARYIPIVRTIAPTLSGTADMHYPVFLAYNILGGISWVVSVALLGFFLGALIPDAVGLMTIAMVIVVALSFVLMFVHGRHRAKKADNDAQASDA